MKQKCPITSQVEEIGPAANRREQTQHGRINSVTSKTSSAHAPAVFNDERGHFLACDSNSPSGHADHDAEHHEPNDNRRKRCAMCVVPSRTSHKHATVSQRNCPPGPYRPRCRASWPDANEGNTARSRTCHCTGSDERDQQASHGHASAVVNVGRVTAKLSFRSIPIMMPRNVGMLTKKENTA